MTEHTTQTAIVNYLDTVLPESCRVVAVSNNPRNATTGRREKARGMRKGFPDLILISKNGTAYLEVKTDKGRLRPEQLEWADWLTTWDHEYAVVRSIDDVKSCLEAWNIQTRAA